MGTRPGLIIIISAIIFNIYMVIICNQTFAGTYPYFEVSLGYVGRSGPIEEVYGGSDLGIGFGGGVTFAPEYLMQKQYRLMFSCRYLRSAQEGITLSDFQDVPGSVSEITIRHILIGAAFRKEMSLFHPYAGIGMCVSSYEENTKWKLGSGNNMNEKSTGSEVGYYVQGGIARSVKGYLEVFTELLYIHTATDSTSFPDDTVNLGGISFFAGARITVPVQ